jgi:hypothetical protein
MPAFFALAGYAAATVLEVKGTRGYALDRARRISLPFLAAIPAVLIPSALIWMLGLKRTQGHTSYSLAVSSSSSS